VWIAIHSQVGEIHLFIVLKKDNAHFVYLIQQMTDSSNSSSAPVSAPVHEDFDQDFDQDYDVPVYEFNLDAFLASLRRTSPENQMCETTLFDPISELTRLAFLLLARGKDRTEASTESLDPDGTALNGTTRQ
jgi:hypothetical protein